MDDPYDHPPPPPPPPPDVAHQSAAIVAVDITQKLIDAASTLSPGELVKDGFFTLFESVSALEIGDPKMDSACEDPHGELDEPYDLSRELLPDEVLGIIDQLLRHEMAWHLGYPLSQTLFTSVYIDEILGPNPHSIEEAHFLRDCPSGYQPPPLLQVLRAYCVGLLKSCGLVAQRIKTETYYEEEDFVSNTYHRTLLDQVDLDPVLLCLQDATALIDDLRGSFPDNLVTALDARMRMRLAFLLALVASHNTADSIGLKNAWAAANDVLAIFKRSVDIQTTPVSGAFSAKIQQKLASTMPPRPIVELSLDDAVGHLTRILQDSLRVVDVVDYSTPEALLTFVSVFQARNSQPLVYVRCLLQGLIFNDMVILGNKSMRQIMDDDFSLVSMSYSNLLNRANDDVEAPHDPRHIMANHMEQFRKKVAPTYFELMRLLCLNRCRVRRSLVHALREWDFLHGEAETLDQILQEQTLEEPLILSVSGNPPMPMHSLPLSSWACLHKLRVMKWFIQLGFELDVYQADELAGMYWYLNYLSKQRFQLLERTKAFVDAHETKARSQRPPRPLVNRQIAASQAFLRFALVDEAISWDLSDALTGLYTALLRLSLVKLPPRPYSTDELRYELRMRPFSTVGVPELVPFETFKDAAEQGDVSTEQLLESAVKSLAGARKGLESLVKLERGMTYSGGCYDAWLGKTKNVLKSCIAMGIAIATLQKMMRSAGVGGEIKGRVEVPEAEKAYHEWWIVPKLIPG